MWAARLAALAVMAALTVVASDAPICQLSGCVCSTTGDYWVRVNCTFSQQQVVNITGGVLPPALLELNLHGGREITLQSNLFSQQRSLHRVRISSCAHLRVRRHAFDRLASPQPLVVVEDCDGVVLETGALRGVLGPLVVVVARCGHVVIQPIAFSWLLEVTVRDVPRLELAEKAFSFERPRVASTGNHGPATKVLLENVIIPELPASVFPSSAAELRLVGVEVRVVRSGAFCGLQLSAWRAFNTSLRRVDEGAFCERTLVQEMEMWGVRVRAVAAGAFAPGAVQHLLIQHSRFQELVGGAINVTVANVTLRDNIFEAVRSRGLNFKSWNHLSVDDNTFLSSEAEALSVRFDHLRGTDNSLSFSRNEIRESAPKAFSFAARALDVTGLSAIVFENRFSHGCRCNLPDWVRATMDASQDAAEFIFNTSFCTVDSLLAKCFNVPQGFVDMRNFTDIVCGSSQVIVCDENKIAIGVVQNSNLPTDGELESELQREKKVLAVIFLAVVSCMAVIVMVTMLLWMRRKGYCLQARIMFLPSTTSCMTVVHRAIEGFRGGGGIVAAGSISRINVRDYADRQQQRVAMIPIDDVGDVDEFVPLEDKWTQTLPEELTQELLQSLREKLDDPENYSEARDMIEHLYDLIKVEESCSNNNTASTSETIEMYDDEENLYDVIQPPLTRRSKAATCSVGTRAPSPDKLLPAATYAEIKNKRRPAVATEYMEPHDHRDHHVYAELPSPRRGPARPLSFLRVLGESLPELDVDFAREGEDLSSGSVALTKAGVDMAKRPLPSKPDTDPGEGTSS